MMNTMKGTSEVDTGHIASNEMALNVKLARRLLIGPILSASQPNPNRPNADAIFHAAKSAAATSCEIPKDDAYKGMKNGGTRRGKVATPEPTNSNKNFASLNNFQSMLATGLTVLSLSSKDAGMVHNSVNSPRKRKVHTTPILVNRESIERERTPPPMPPPA